MEKHLKVHKHEYEEFLSLKIGWKASGSGKISNARQIGGIKTMKSLQHKYKNEKKFAKQRTSTIENTDEQIQLAEQERANSQWIKIDTSEDFQDNMFDENLPLKRSASQSPLSFPFNRPRIQNGNEGLKELKEEGLKLDIEYKKLLIEKIQLEKKVLFQKSQLEKVKLELEIKKLKIELSHQQIQGI